MATVYPALLSLVLTALTLTSYHRYSSHEQATSGSVNKERGDRKNLTVYAMAVGQGDGNIILCPNGKDIVIVDMGDARQYKYTDQSYGSYLLVKKFGALGKNIHIVITHPDEDHYSFLPVSFHSDVELTRSVKEIVLGGSYKKYKEKRRLQPWLNNISRIIPVYTVNNGSECFGNSACRWTPVSTTAIKMTKKPRNKDPWQFCGDDVHITILGANICGETCNPNDTNEHSIILKLVYKEWSIFMSGDFEGKRQQTKLIERWSHALSMLQSTYYKVSHHGAWRKEKQANLPELLEKIQPKRAFISHGHPITTCYNNLNHPRCEVIDNLLNKSKIDSANSSIICWKDGTNGKVGNLELRSGYAIYETCPKYLYYPCLGIDRQLCHDILITSDGHHDYTTYVDVPRNYTYQPKPSNYKPKQCCIKCREALKHSLSQLHPNCEY